MPFEETVGERVLDMEDLSQHETTDEEDNCLELRNLSPSLDNIEVILTNKYPQLQGFGLDIKGGKDRPYISDDPGIFVSAVKPAGLAERSGKINVGDKIVEVNGKPVVSVTHAEAVELFLLDRSKVTLFLQKNAAQLIRAASLTPTPTSATGSITPDSDRSISPRRNGRAPEYETNLSISGFVIGLALGCVTVVLLRRYLNATPTKT
ncbi:protein scribble homolog [Hydractinia symbiolongicarpus]|uniref:protein scribble homolog n=1 Tax=Hydractinia symbiolongicarpus TaxID=13093 RepID=UPI00254BF305|nr:protein scribble homolog [Hydractinia symbiolongicarpus]